MYESQDSTQVNRSSEKEAGVSYMILRADHKAMEDVGGEAFCTGHR